MATLVVLLALGGVLAWHQYTRLSDQERAVVGVWSRPVSLAAPDDALHVVEYRDDRTVWMGVFGPDGAPLPGSKTLVGRWWVEDGVLVVDYESRPYVGLSSRLDGWIGARRLRVERLAIEAATPERLELRSPVGGPPLLFRPHHDGRWVWPDRAATSELAGSR